MIDKNELIQAIDEDNKRKIKSLIKNHNKEYLDQIDAYTGFTALIYSCFYGHYDIVDLLINSGADLNIQANDGYTALMYACESEELEIIDLLIKNGADLNIQTSDGFTALMNVCDFGYFDIVKILVENGADTTIKNNDGETALDFIKGLFGTKSKEEDADRYKIVQYLSELKRVQYLSGLETKPNIQKNSNLKTSNKSVNKYYDDNYYKHTPLIDAIIKDDFHTVKTLVESGVDINQSDTTYYDKYTPLMNAVFYGNFEMVKYLVEHGADVNQLNSKQANALFFVSCRKNFVDIIKYLLDMKINIYQKNDDNNTVLSELIYKSHYDDIIEVIKCFIDNGFNINEVNDYGNTLLMYFASLDFLSSYDASGIIKSIEIIEFLLSSGASLTIKNKYGKTTLDIAKEKGRITIATYLSAHLSNTKQDDEDKSGYKNNSNNNTIDNVIVKIESESENDYIPSQKKPKSLLQQARGQYYNRDQSIVSEVKSLANYKCFFDSSHATFITDDGNPYMEAHHIIPIKYKDRFKDEIDIIENMICLCPLCHRKIHFGNDNDKTSMLQLIVNQINNPKNPLHNLPSIIDIKITLSYLKELYNPNLLE